MQKLDKQNMVELSPDLVSAIQTLWALPSVQAAYARRNEFQINDSAK